MHPPSSLRAADITSALAVLWLAHAARSNTGLRETLVAVTARELITFHAAQPDRILGGAHGDDLAPGRRLVGIDFRVAGACSMRHRNGPPVPSTFPSGRAAAPRLLRWRFRTVFGFDFNPAADRIRVVSNMGQNLRPPRHRGGGR